MNGAVLRWLGLSNWRWPRLARIAIALFVLGCALAAAAFFAAPLGLGVVRDFVLYRLFAVARREAFIMGAGLAALSVGLLVWARFGFGPPGRRAHNAGNTGLLIASTLLGLLAGEIVLRLMDGISLWPPRNIVAEGQALLRIQTANDYHPVLGWVLKPGTRANAQDVQTSFTTGEHGVRMNAPEVRPLPQGAILAVGDSFTAGSEVADSFTWPAHLERMLSEPVVNAAVGGWGADQIVLRAELMLPVARPKTVIASFFAHDIVRAGLRVYGGANKPWFTLDEGRLVHHNNPVPRFTGRHEELGGPLLGYSYLVSWLLERAGFGAWWRQVNTSYVEADNDPVAVSCALLARLKEETDRRNVRLLFVLQYSGHDHLLSTGEHEHPARVAACAERAGIEVLDLWPPLVGAYRKGLASFRRLFVMHEGGRVYGHMSSEGNAFVAREIAARLRTAPKQ